MRYIIFCLWLSSCGYVDQFSAHIKGHTTDCIDGVAYLIFPQAVTVKYTPDGKILACK